MASSQSRPVELGLPNRNASMNHVSLVITTQRLVQSGHEKSEIIPSSGSLCLCLRHTARQQHVLQLTLCMFVRPTATDSATSGRLLSAPQPEIENEPPAQNEDIHWNIGKGRHTCRQRLG
ncbi:hypothetical protein ZHAS_00005527 [Anopheles sinensis]|uniref:Uncharacterized protein n=1 Tax=Anopheles sinensis TaxID=74873 RepID=A0A084VJR9_ANOSI|nr:hypothetical protein ZHAS_00005527 [Anopheles sinensis]